MQQRSKLPLLARALGTLALVAYPLLVWRGLATGSPRQIALVLLALLVPTTYLRRRSEQQAETGSLMIIPLVTIVCLGLASALNRQGFILLVPVAINLVFLGSFGATLRAGARPMIERFARLQEPDLPVDKQAWCRLWTKIWCVFFVLNGAAAGLLAWLAPLEWWAFYTGLLAYILSGVLLGGEWLLRRRRFQAGSA
ncbi:MAG: putative membrane protein [Planctomycetota bacterium]|jgi:uncharacterized membrane protein